MPLEDRSELQRLYKEMVPRLKAPKVGREVFRCPHPLATMSIEEAADLEIAEMRQQEAEKAIQEARARAAEADRW